MAVSFGDVTYEPSFAPLPGGGLGGHAGLGGFGGYGGGGGGGMGGASAGMAAPAVAPPLASSSIGHLGRSGIGGGLGGMGAGAAASAAGTFGASGFGLGLGGLSTLEADISRLQAQHSAETEVKQHHIRALGTELSATRTSLDDARRQLEDERQHTSHTSAILNAREAVHNKLQQDFDALSKKLTAVTAAWESERAALAAEQQRVHELKTKLDEALAALGKHRAALVEIEAEDAGLKSSNDSLAKELTHEREMRASLEQEVANAKAAVRRSQRDLTTEKQLRTQAETMLARQREDHAAVQRHLEDDAAHRVQEVEKHWQAAHDKQRHKYEATLSKLRDELAKSEQLLVAGEGALRDEVESVKRNLKRAVKAQRAAEAHAEALQQQNAQLQAQLDEHGREREAIQERVRMSEAGAQQHRDQLLGVQALLKQTQLERDRTAAELHEVKTALSARVTELQAALDDERASARIQMKRIEKLDRRLQVAKDRQKDKDETASMGLQAPVSIPDPVTGLARWYHAVPTIAPSGQLTTALVPLDGSRAMLPYVPPAPTPAPAPAPAPAPPPPPPPPQPNLTFAPTTSVNIQPNGAAEIDEFDGVHRSTRRYSPPAAPAAPRVAAMPVSVARAQSGDLIATCRRQHCLRRFNVNDNAGTNQCGFHPSAPHVSFDGDYYPCCGVLIRPGAPNVFCQFRPHLA